MDPWYQLSGDEVLRRLGTTRETGLNTEQVRRLQEEYGPNELLESGGRGPGQILLEQFRGAMILLLVAAALVSVYLHEYTDAVAILAIVVLNAALGFFQDYRAERALAALRKLAVPTVRVRREGTVSEMSAGELVPGDIVLLEVGQAVPADGRVLESVNLKVAESALTGESEAVSKQARPIPGDDLPLGDRQNMVHMGTTVTYGHAEAAVVATGMQTELGHIAHSLQTVRSEPTPLQRRLANLGRVLAAVALGIVAVVFVVGLFAGEDPRRMLMTALSLAVAIVPEGLPAVATVGLALGARRMIRRHALIRKLPAVETLGSVTVICSDKTGTLTRNEMTVTILDVAGRRLDQVDRMGPSQPPRADDSRSADSPSGDSPSGDSPSGDSPSGERPSADAPPADTPDTPSADSFAAERRSSAAMPSAENPSAAGRSAAEGPAEVAEAVAGDPALPLLLAGAGLCNDAELQRDQARQAFRGIGDPTETALIVAAAELGFVKGELAASFPRIGEVPFDSERKRMTTIHAVRQNGSPAAGEGERRPDRSVLTALQPLEDGEHLAFTKGAVDAVVEACEYVWDAGEPTPITAEWRQRIRASNDELAGRGMRVLGVAFRPLDAPPGDGPPEEAERDLIFVGMLAMIDPPREEAREAVARCRTAGIRPVMITGDHPLTAQQIAEQLDIIDGGRGRERVVGGQELQRMSTEELEAIVEEVSVYARVSPRDKLRIVQALQKRGHVVAMTGDGVNDAPALKQAQIGVAMGRIGTDVAKEASDMVLLDDNFATIVGAVEEGRVVYDNIRKFVKYTMTSNTGEVWVMLLGPLLGMPLPLLPLQILWVNLVTDGLPGLALATEPAEKDTMRRPPYPPEEGMFSRGMGWDIGWIGLLMGVVSLALGYADWRFAAASEEHWRTIVFTVLTLAQMGNALATRSRHESLFQIGLFSNKALLGSVLLTFVLQMAVVYLPSLQRVFRTTALTAGELIACLALSTVVFWAIEARKLLWRLRERGQE